jgi:hypothetical protein
MKAARAVPTTLYHDSDSTGAVTPYPPSGTLPRAPGSRTTVSRPVDPVEEALLARSPCGFCETDFAVREARQRLAFGDEEGATAALRLIAARHPILVTTVSPDVLDEIELDRCAALFLAHIDGRAALSRVLSSCPLPEVECVRTLCELIDRRIVALRR